MQQISHQELELELRRSQLGISASELHGAITGIICASGAIALDGLWSLVLNILGAFYGHRTDAWRAVVAYFIPLIVCCGIMMMFWFLIAGVAAAQSM